MDWIIGVGSAFGIVILKAFVMIFAFFFMSEDSTPSFLKVICGLVGGGLLLSFFDF